MELLENSSNQTSFSPAAKPANPATSINIKKEIGKYLRKWPYMVISALLFYAAARIYLRYTQPQYLTQATLKLEDSKSKNPILSGLSKDGMFASGTEDLQAEASVILSKPILAKVVNNLSLDTNFFSVGKIKGDELYRDSPVRGKILKLIDPSAFTSAEYLLLPAGGNSFKLGESPRTYTFGNIIQLPFGVVQLGLKPGARLRNEIRVVFTNPSSVVNSLEKEIVVELPENKVGLMNVSTVGPVPAKSEDILNELNKQYIRDGLIDKNREAESTQEFINDRLEVITNDLSGIEGQKETFKRNNQIVDLESQAQEAVATVSESTKKVLELTSTLEAVNSVYSATNGERLIPSNMGVPSSVESLIEKYNDLLLTKNRVSKQATGANPSMIQMNKEIDNLKSLIRQNLLTSRETLQLQLAQAQGQINLSKGNISRFPSQEKMFRSIDRQQTLKEQLYLYLLQKREENAISLANKAPKAKIVNPAYTVGVVKPKYNQILYGATAAGFLLPLLFFVGIGFLDTRINSKESITALYPDASVIGEIPLQKDGNAVVHSRDFGVFAEAFRILTSNIKFILKAKNNENKGVILVTSSIKGEGKTTISMNTAQTLAGKSKVLIIGADIRNPQLPRFIEGPGTGLTDYLVSDDITPDRFIFNSNLNPNLDVMFSGQMAPNPNDLLDMHKFDEMIEILRQRYEYIVIDSAPVMLVSDTMSMVDVADLVVYVSKSQYTEREMINFAMNFKNEHQIQNLGFVINSVKPEYTRYGTKYGYGYYSYTQEEQVPWWKRLFS